MSHVSAAPDGRAMTMQGEEFEAGLTALGEGGVDCVFSQVSAALVR